MNVGKIFDITTIAFALAAFILYLLLWVKDPAAAKTAAQSGLSLFLRYSFLIIFSLLIGAILPALIPKELISHYLGGASGWRGIVLAAFLGGLTPGSPYAVFPLIAGLTRQGMGLAPAVSMVCAWGLWSMGRVPFQAAVMGGRFTLLQVLASLPLPFLAGALAGLWQRFIP